MKLTVVVGNPKPMSRTRAVAEAVAEHVAGVTGAESTGTIDLCDHAESMFRWPDDAMSRLNDRVAASDLLVVASPTYKATYTGLLKGFLDRYPNNGLAGVTAIPVMTGGSADHAMAIDTGLRPLLVELGASVPTRGLFFVMSQMEQMAEVVAKWAQLNLTSDGPFGPMRRGGSSG